VTTSEERLKILTMIQNGKITAEEGARLIDALEERGVRARPEDAPPDSSVQRRQRWFRIRITDARSGKPRVNVRLPVDLVSAGLKMGARLSPEVQGLSAEKIMEWIDAGAFGQVADLESGESGERIEVFIESG